MDKLTMKPIEVEKVKQSPLEKMKKEKKKEKDASLHGFSSLVSRIIGCIQSMFWCRFCLFWRSRTVDGALSNYHQTRFPFAPSGWVSSLARGGGINVVLSRG